MRAEMGEDLAHFDDSDSEDGDSGKPSLVLVNPERRQSTYPKQEVYDCFSGIQLLNTVKTLLNTFTPTNLGSSPEEQSF